MSKLASVQRIIQIDPIPGADAIEVATVLGWKVVVKKGEYKVGDLCCYIQIDTVVPEMPEFEFLRERNFRVRTIKLRKQISQGLIVPVPDCKKYLVAKGFKEGDEVTDIIGVKKYEKPDNNPQRYEKPRMPKVWYKKWLYLFKYNILYKLLPTLRPKSRSPFPSNLVSKTDEERIQNMPQVLQSHKGKWFVTSYKLDGSSITIIHNKAFGKSKFRICSRNFELHDKKNDWYNVFKSGNWDQEILKLVKYYSTDDIIVQGECIGKFNGNHHNLQQDQIRLFNIYVDGKRINQEQFVDICRSHSIPMVPPYRTILLDHSLEVILQMSEIKDAINPAADAEGLVWRCIEDNTSFKVINNKYLLKES